MKACGGRRLGLVRKCCTRSFNVADVVADVVVDVVVDVVDVADVVADVVGDVVRDVVVGNSDGAVA